MTKHTKVGFWHSTTEPHLLKPVPSLDPWEGKHKFLLGLKATEEMADAVTFKGVSKCRICGCHNGCVEFEYGGFVWPAGLAHYVENHNVMPPKEFVDFINEAAG